MNRRPDCLPGSYDPDAEDAPDSARVCGAFGLPEEACLFPHRMLRDPDDVGSTSLLTDNELLVEMAGRGCYQSWGGRPVPGVDAVCGAHGSLRRAPPEHAPR